MWEKSLVVGNSFLLLSRAFFVLRILYKYGTINPLNNASRNISKKK